MSSAPLWQKVLFEGSDEVSLAPLTFAGCLKMISLIYKNLITFHYFNS